MRSEGSRFTLGVWGWGCVRHKLRLRPPPFATVGNRRQPSLVTLSLCANATGVDQKVCRVGSWRRSCMGVCRGGVCVSDLWRRSYNGVCRGSVCLSDLWRRSCNSACIGGVCLSDLRRRSYIGVCKGVCRSYIGVCREGVSVSDLCRRRFFGVCRGVCLAKVSIHSVLHKCQEIV